MSDIESRARAAASKAKTLAEDEKPFRMNWRLTSQERHALDFIQNYMHRERGVSPSYEEIRIALSLSSKSRVYQIMHSLEDAGYLRIGRNRMRAIELLRQSDKAPVRPDKTPDVTIPKTGSVPTKLTCAKLVGLRVPEPQSKQKGAKS